MNLHGRTEHAFEKEVDEPNIISPEARVQLMDCLAEFHWPRLSLLQRKFRVDAGAA
jgi:hypothetical protein